MAKINNVLMVGVGGQGIILSSNIFSLAIMKEGHDIKKSEIHGMSQRGGSVFSHVRYGEKVYSPVIPKGEAEIIFALETMEVLRWSEFAHKDAKVIYLKNDILPSTVDTYPEGIEEEIKRLFPDSISITQETLKEDGINAKMVNVALLGAMSQYLEIKEESWKEAIEELVPEGTFELNMAAFEVGKKMTA